MKKEVFFNKKLIPRKIGFYKDYLLSDFTRNIGYTNLANSLFLQGLGISNYISGLKLYNFRNAEYSGTEIPERMYCDLVSLDNISISVEKIPAIPEDERFFPNRDTRMLDPITGNSYPFYYLISDNFVQHVDDLFYQLLKSVSGFTEANKSKTIVSKQIGEGVFLKFNKRRREFNFFSPWDYLYPEFQIEINEVNYFVSSETDIKTFLFFPATSFHFFYELGHHFTRTENGQIVKVDRRNNEPILFYNKEQGSLFLANSRENKRRYVKYIFYTTLLLSHYITVFEKWFIDYMLTEIKELDEFKNN